MSAAGIFIRLFAASAVLFGLHLSLFRLLPGTAQTDFRYSLPELYAFFTGCAAVVMAVVWIVSRRNHDHVGMSFLIVSSAKMVMAWLFFRPVQYDAGTAKAEKMNFLALFILFLVIETLLTIRILNKKQ